MNKIKFIRFGGLSPVKQHRYTTNEDEMGFHYPPAKYGFYAFHQKYIDLFLLGATYHPFREYAKGEWIKDECGNLIENSKVIKGFKKDGTTVYVDWFLKLMKKRKIKSSRVWTSRLKAGEDIKCEFEGECEDCENYNLCTKHYMVKIKEPKIFTHTGEIWHHLPAFPSETIAEKGSWVKSSYDDYVNILNRYRHSMLKEAHKMASEEKDWKYKMRATDPFVCSPTITYAKDELEVFIEKLKT
jgi:hypothetical protein